MASAKGVKAGEAFVKLGGDESALVRALASSRRHVEAFGRYVRNIGAGLAAAGVAGITAGAGMAKVFADAGSQIFDMSKRTGMTAEALSELQFAVEQNGASMTDLESSIQSMQRTVVMAESGFKRSEKALAAMGLAASDFKGLNPEQQFALVAEALSRIEDPTKRAAMAMRVLGTSGTKLLPLLSGGAAGLAAARAEAARFGQTITTEAAAKADILGDSLDAIVKGGRAVTIAIGQALAPVFTDMATRIANAIGPIVAWIRENSTLVTWLFSAAAAATVLGGAMVVLGTVLSSAVAIGTAAVAAFGAIVSPLGLVAAGVVGLGAALVALIGPSTVIQTLGDWFNWLKDVAIEAFIRIQHIVGNWQAYMSLALNVVQLALVSFASDVQHFFTVAIPAYLLWLSRNWQNLLIDMANVVSYAAENIGKNFLNLFSAIQSWMAGEGFNFTPVAILDGFTSVLEALPKIATREMNEVERILQGAIDRGKAKLDTDFSQFRAEQLEKLAGGGPKLPSAADAEALGARIGAGIASAAKTSSSGSALTFSGANLGQIAGVSGPLNNLLDETETQTETLDEINDGIGDVASGIDRLATSLTFA